MREIYVIMAKVVDANGSFNDLSGYPKVFDTNHYDGNLAVTTNRAFGAYHEALGAMCKVDTRQLQLAAITRVSDGAQVASTVIGGFSDGE